MTDDQNMFDKFNSFQSPLLSNLNQLSSPSTNDQSSSTPFPFISISSTKSPSSHLPNKYPSLLTDYGNALRFSQHFGDQVRFVPSWGWLLFDGTRWQPDTTHKVLSLASACMFSYYDDLPTIKNDTLREATAKHAQRSLSASQLNTLLDLACFLPGILMHPTDFNANPHLLTVLNGTIDLRSGDLLPHDPLHYITHLVPVPYDLDAHSPVWDDFLILLTHHESSLANFLQRAVGYSLTGLTDEGSCFLLTGPGERIQELFLSTLRTLFGSYATHTLSLRPKSLTISLLTSRFLTTNSETLFSPSHFAALGTLIKAQPLLAPTASSDAFPNLIHPTCKLWLSTPSISDFPTALAHLRSRVNLVPISHMLTEQEFFSFTCHLRDALPAILAWAVKGLFQQPIARGLQPPSNLLLSSPVVQDDQDDLTAFLECCLTTDQPANTIRAHELYHAYLLWSHSQGAPVLSEKVFGRSLLLRNIHRTRDAFGRLYHGLTLTFSIDQLTYQLQNSPYGKKLRKGV